jgi:BirA family biotin operon repressor/biotin-[acetyl-CoA-carboxylase] ligase
MSARERKSFDLARVEAGIGGTRFAGQVRHVAVTESTNQLATWAADGGAGEGAWIADEQTAGRGRGGHVWHSSPGDGLYVSILVLPWIPLSYAVNLPLAAGLAAQAAVREATGLAIDLRWPNDLMLGGKKCGGILVESASAPAPEHWRVEVGPQLRYAVIGVGLNLNHSSFPPEIAPLATSLHLQSGRYYEREPLLAALLRRIEDEITVLRREWSGHHSAQTLHARFTAASSWVNGMHVQVGEEGGYTGWTRGLDARGFLLVEDESGLLRTVLSGGVRPA